MKNILLCCSCGLSSSMLCSKMRKVAETRDDGPYKIWATSIQEAKEIMGEVDFLLIGPHMRAMAKTVSDMADEKGVPWLIVDRMDYAYGNGKAVFEKMDSHLAKRGEK